MKNDMLPGGDPRYLISVLVDELELYMLKEKALKQEALEVIDEDGITFACPSCYADNSKWIDWSMLQRQPKRAKRCQECGQLIKWEK